MKPGAILGMPACAATLEIAGDTLVMGGYIVPGDDAKVAETLREFPRVTSIAFDNCMGGDVSTGYLIAEIIKRNGLDTVVRSQCHSSCVYAFLAGKNRQFGSSLGMHAILLHAARNVDETNDVASKINPSLMRYLVSLTKGKLTPEVTSMIASSNSVGQGVVFVYYNYLIYRSRKSYYCNGSEHGELANCRMLKDADAFALGVISAP